MGRSGQDVLKTLCGCRLEVMHGPCHSVPVSKQTIEAKAAGLERQRVSLGTPERQATLQDAVCGTHRCRPKAPKRNLSMLLYHVHKQDGELLMQTRALTACATSGMTEAMFSFASTKLCRSPRLVGRPTRASSATSSASTDRRWRQATDVGH